MALVLICVYCLENKWQTMQHWCLLWSYLKQFEWCLDVLLMVWRLLLGYGIKTMRRISNDLTNLWSRMPACRRHRRRRFRGRRNVPEMFRPRSDSPKTSATGVDATTGFRIRGRSRCGAGSCRSRCRWCTDAQLGAVHTETCSCSGIWKWEF